MLERRAFPFFWSLLANDLCTLCFYDFYLHRYSDIYTYVGQKNGFLPFPHEGLLLNNKVNQDRLDLCHQIFDIEDNV